MKIAAGAWVLGVWLAGLLAVQAAWAQPPEKALPEKMSIDLGGGVKMDFVLIKPGSFMMGSKNGLLEDERPVHKVTITKPFYMGVYEVTQAQWKALMGDNPFYFKGDALPVEQVSWEDCQRFLAKLNQRAGQGRICRLPTEAEWEYACRAGSTSDYCFGDDDRLGDYAWYPRNSGYKTHPVGQKKPNAWGLYDMHGNVWEWCSDWYDAAYYAESPGKDPKGPSTGQERVVRGGSWFLTVESAYRIKCLPSDRIDDHGCRVVMSAQE